MCMEDMKQNEQTNQTRYEPKRTKHYCQPKRTKQRTKHYLTNSARYVSITSRKRLRREKVVFHTPVQKAAG